MLLDTSIITEIFIQGKKNRHQTFEQILDVIEKEAGDEDDSSYISMAQLAEIADWCAKNRISPKDGMENLKRIRADHSLDEDICEASVTIKSRRPAGADDFGLIDAIILASARSVNQRLLTLDRHFEGEPDCIILKQKGVK